MAIPFDADPERSTSHSHAVSHLIAPLAAGAVDTPFSLDAAGVVDIPLTTREPFLVAAPVSPLDNESWLLDATLQLPGPPKSLPTLEFAPYTEAGAFLPVFQPPVDADRRTAAPFRISFKLRRLDSSGAVTSVAAADLPAFIQVRLMEGVLGRLVYALLAEKQRMRRQAREIAAMRILARARDNALDRTGAGLGVLRFPDEIRFDTIRKEIVTETRIVNGKPAPEPDSEYRNRLGIYRPFLLSNRACSLNALNGPGGEADPNAGLISNLGFKPRFRLQEGDNEFAVAVQIIGAGGAQFRDNFFALLRQAYLVLPEDTPANTAIYAARFLSTVRRQQEDALRTSLRQRFNLPAGAALTPLLARSIDLLGRCREALGAGKLNLLRAQDPSQGSRYELGLGADLARIPAADLDLLVDAALNPTRPPSPPEIEALLQSMKPAHAIADPDGAWLLSACGLVTHYRVDDTRIFVSHLPVDGLRITVTGPPSVGVGVAVPLRADYDGPGVPGANAALQSGLTAALADWTASGGEALNQLSDADAHARWDHARAVTVDEAASLAGTGLPAVRDPAAVAQQLHRLPPELVRTLQFGSAMTKGIRQHEADIGEKLTGLMTALRRQSLTSALLLLTDANEALLVVGVIGLPESGLNLSDRRATGFRWYVAPIQGAGDVKPVGSRSVYVPATPGLAAVVVLGFVRRNAGDPYEVRVALPDGALLNIKQYEFLMNFLEEICPMGVEINTFLLRRQQVDLDQDGSADPLPPSVARTFRQFRRSGRIEAAATLNS